MFTLNFMMVEVGNLETTYGYLNLFILDIGNLDIDLRDILFYIL